MIYGYAEITDYMVQWNQKNGRDLERIKTMIKFKKMAAILFAATFVVSGCGSNAEKENDSIKEEAISKEATSKEADKENADSESKQNGVDKTIVVYSPQGDELRGTWIKDKAKADLGVDIQFLCAGGGELSDRLVAEKNNPQADVVMGLAQNAMYKLKTGEILDVYEPAWAEGLPEVYRDKDGYFNSFWQTPIVIAYNPDFLSADKAPKGWEDLNKPEYNGLFGIGVTSSQTTRTYLVGMLWKYYDAATGEISQEGWDFLSQVYENAGTLPSSDPDIWKAFKDGEMPILPWWYGGVVSNCEKNQIPVEFVKPGSGTPVVAEAIGLVKGGKNQDGGKKFIDWFGSAEVMAAYAKEFGQAPALPEAIELCPDEVKQNAMMFTAQNIDWEVAAQNLDQWLEKIELEIMP